MVFVLYGSRFYGVVDRAPGLFHIATRFLHINYVPIVPLQSYILGVDGRTGRAVRLRPKSVFVGYLRGLLAPACYLLVVAGTLLAGMAGVPAAVCAAYSSPASTQSSNVGLQASDVGFVGGIAVGVLLAVALVWAHTPVLTDWPRPGDGHPATARLRWHLALTGFVLLLGGGVLWGGLAVRDMVIGRDAELLTYLPMLAGGCLASTLLFSYGYRLTLFLTPASYERALALADEFGLPRQLVEERYQRNLQDREHIGRQP